MGIIVNWDEKDNHILYYTFKDEWTWEELSAAFIKAGVLLDKVSYVATVIMDFSESGRIPLDDMFTKARLVAKDRHERQGEHLAFVGANRIITSSLNRLSSLYPRIMPQNIYYAKTIEEARKILQKASSANR